METTRTIPLTRRTYNKWVADETLEDFALRFTAKRARKWSVSRIANTALGTVSFLVLEAIGGTVTLSYGFTNSLYAILVVCALLFLTGIPVTYYAARYGVDIDLLTRGAGFGYIGSTISSLIYASFTFIFFALEAAIMSMALHLLLDIPLPLTYVISSLIVIPLVTHGIAMISRFQVLTQPVWLVLQVLPFIYILQHDSVSLQEWMSFPGVGESEDRGFDFLLFGGACAILFSMVAQIGEQVDFLRFMPEKTPKNRLRWWTALIAAGPGWVLFGIIKLLIGSFLAYLALSQGVLPALAGDPTHMYQVAFGFVTESPFVSLLLASVFVIICQLKINVANAYAGSLAWSNFFSRITHYHPGRVVWVVFNVSIALLLMELGVYQALEQILQTYSALVLAWIGAIVADLVINKPLGLSPAHIEFKRSRLYDINPVGVGSMALASVLAILSHLGTFGDFARALSPFIALFLPFLTVPLIALATRSRYYLVGDAPEEEPGSALQTCSICEHRFDAEDMALCPAYSGLICSLCCSLDSRCGDQCRPGARLTEQVNSVVGRLFPGRMSGRINPTLTHFTIVFLCVSFVVSALLALVYFQINFSQVSDQELVFSILGKTFLLLLIVLGVLTWLYVLSQESRRNALQESQQQTRLLMEEVSAHEQTSDALQKAKENAESANLAKSRYLTGISHELRTPLNVVMGYAQILENSQDLSDRQRSSVALMHRNCEHLAELIEGLLEISKIEAGRLEIHKDVVSLHALLDQIVSMFRQQAQSRGLEFNYQCSPYLPETVLIDVKRLRQILFNLLSNAIKFTPQGSVSLEVSYRSQVAQFVIRDTGIGIASDDQHRIFEPFERVRNRETQQITGTGIGLAITRLLADLLGGEISIDSTPGQGSTFTLSLHVSKLEDRAEMEVPVAHRIRGYQGPVRHLMLVDDDPQHRKLMQDLLAPMGFELHCADHAEACIAQLDQHPVDLFLLDIFMPDMDGWALARHLREHGHLQPVILLSASHRDQQELQLSTDLGLENLVKPVQFPLLLQKLAQLLNLNWDYELPTEPVAHAGEVTGTRLDNDSLDTLRSLAEIGYLDGLQEHLQSLGEHQHIDPQLMRQLQDQLQACNLNEFIRQLEQARH